MKAKARDAHATIVTCVPPPYILALRDYLCYYCCCMLIPSLCLHTIPYFRAIIAAFAYIMYLVSVTVIPTSYKTFTIVSLTGFSLYKAYRLLL